MPATGKVFYLLTEDLSEAKDALTKSALDAYASKQALITVMAALIPVNLSTGPIVKISGESISAPETPDDWTGTIDLTGIKPGDAEIIDFRSAEYAEIEKEVKALIKQTDPDFFTA